MKLYIIFALSIVAARDTKPECPVCAPPIKCKEPLDEQITTEILSVVLSMLLVVSEILPFLSYIKANGLAEFIYMILFRRRSELSVQSNDYGSI